MGLVVHVYLYIYIPQCLFWNLEQDTVGMAEQLSQTKTFGLCAANILNTGGL